MDTSEQQLSKREILFQAFKYTIYALLTYNIFLFYQGEVLSSAETYPNGIAPLDIILAYSATIDTVAWVLLLLLFELETFVLSDDTVNGPLKWPLNFFKLLSYGFIFYAFYGYSYRLLFLLNNSPFLIDDVCSLIGTSFSYVVTLDEYVPITQEVCSSMNNSMLLQVNGTEIIATEELMGGALALGWVDVINALDWLLIVAILEIDVYWQLKGQFTGKIESFSQISKPILYGILFIAAIYWGFNGDFVDFWDAFLWLLAFFFIEMNLFEWQAETKEAQQQKLKEIN